MNWERPYLMNVRSFRGSGCSQTEYLAVKAVRGAVRAFQRHRQNARDRGIGWHLNLWQWWTIWQESGRWPQRGSNGGFAMCRNGDVGPYAVGNVYIATMSQNTKDYWINKRARARATA